MSNIERIILGVVLGVAGIALAFWALQGRTGQGRYMVVGEGQETKLVSVPPREYRKQVNVIERDPALTVDEKQERIQALDKQFYFSWPRTIGIWIAAFFTLAILSFLYRDNPFYRFAEHVFVGIGAGYGMALTAWAVIVPNLLMRLFPQFVREHLNPGARLDEAAERLATISWLRGIIPYEQAVDRALAAPWYLLMDYWLWIPVVLGVMLVWRMAPRGGWISRWPLAFIIGGIAGMRLVAFLGADFVAQIEAGITPLYVPVYDSVTGLQDGGKTFYESFNNILLLLGTLCALLYFFFSLEHRGVVGRLSRVGIWVLMITFGAGFGYTVMGRIALLVSRFQFLINDWIGYEPLV
jgi:hypothetical protein